MCVSHINADTTCNIKLLTSPVLGKKSSLNFIDNPMKRWLQIATDDVDAPYVIGEGDARVVATSNIVPLVVPCALTVVVVELVVMAGQGLGLNWERTPLPPVLPRLRYGTPATHGGHGHGRGRGAHAEVQLHGYHGQGRPHFGVSEAAGLPAQPSRLRLLPGHDQLVSAGMQGPVVGQQHDAYPSRLIC